MFKPPASLRPSDRAHRGRSTGTSSAASFTTRPRATMGGVAGHAGLFTTADDLVALRPDDAEHGRARRCKRLFSPLTIRKFTSPQSPADQPVLRGFGWDIDSPFSGNRGELFPHRLVRPHRLHGHVAVDRSLHADVCDPACEQRSSVARKESDFSPGLGVATITAAALGVDVPGVVIDGYEDTILGAGLHRTVARNGAVFDRPGCVARTELRPTARQAGRD